MIKSEWGDRRYRTTPLIRARRKAEHARLHRISPCIHACTARPLRYRMPNRMIYVLSHSREREIHLDTARLHPGTQTARSSARDERRSRISSHDRSKYIVWLKTSGTESIKEHQKFCNKILLFLMFQTVPIIFNILNRLRRRRRAWGKRYWESFNIFFNSSIASF